MWRKLKETFQNNALSKSVSLFPEKGYREWEFPLPTFIRYYHSERMTRTPTMELQSWLNFGILKTLIPVALNFELWKEKVAQ